MGQFSSHEPFAPNNFTLSQWRELYKDGLVTEHHPPLMAPTMSQMEPPGTEDSPRAHYVGHSLERSVLHYPPRALLYHNLISPAILGASLESISESLLQVSKFIVSKMVTTYNVVGG